MSVTEISSGVGVAVVSGAEGPEGGYIFKNLKLRVGAVRLGGKYQTVIADGEAVCIHESVEKALLMVVATRCANGEHDGTTEPRADCDNFSVFGRQGLLKVKRPKFISDVGFDVKCFKGGRTYYTPKVPFKGHIEVRDECCVITFQGTDAVVYWPHRATIRSVFDDAMQLLFAVMAVDNDWSRPYLSLWSRSTAGEDSVVFTDSEFNVVFKEIV